MDFSIPINWMSPFPNLGVSDVFLIEFPVSKQRRPYQMLRSVESDLALHCLPRSHKCDARLIWVN